MRQYQYHQQQLTSNLIAMTRRRQHVSDQHFCWYDWSRKSSSSDSRTTNNTPRSSRQSDTTCSLGVGVVSIRRQRIEECIGKDYVVISTNRQLEGNHRKHWWGFAGKTSCDSSLYDVYQQQSNNNKHHERDYLLKEARKQGILIKQQQQQQQQMTNEDGTFVDKGEGEIVSPSSLLLSFGSCIITNSGPKLNSKFRNVVHACVPRFPNTTSRKIQANANAVTAAAAADDDDDGDDYLHTTLPHAWVESDEEAYNYLKICYDTVFTTILNHHYQNNNNSHRCQEKEESFNTKWNFWWNTISFLSTSLFSVSVSSLVFNNNCNNGNSNGNKISNDAEGIITTMNSPSSIVSICLPAIGCGINRYPSRKAANIALDCIYDKFDVVVRKKEKNRIHECDNDQKTNTADTKSAVYDESSLLLAEAEAEVVDERVQDEYNTNHGYDYYCRDDKKDDNNNNKNVGYHISSSIMQAKTMRHVVIKICIKNNRTYQIWKEEFEKRQISITK